MKTLISILGGLLFALLFHDQLLGLNTLLFSAFLVTALLLMNRKVSWTFPLTLSILTLIGSAVAITWHGSLAARWCYFASLFLFLGFVACSQSSYYMSVLNGVYNVLLGIFHDFLYPSARKADVEPKKTRFGEQSLSIGIPLLLVFIFVSFYREANPVFHRWLEVFYLQLDAIDFLWFFTATVASFLMLNIIQPNPVVVWTQVDLTSTEKLSEVPPSQLEQSSWKTELKIGTYSMIVLNVLLVFVLISEFMFLMNLSDFDVVELSKAVHYGVYSSIASIVLAILLISFVFRGALNWIQQNSFLKTLSYLWMVLNMGLLGTIAMKNLSYITQYGLTEKRIGVLIYLLLCLLGIGTVFIKVQSRLNFRFLVRKNLGGAFGILTVLGLFNWSSLITRYNIENEHIELAQLEYYFPQNALVLKEHGLLTKMIEDPGHNYYKLNRKMKETQNRNWQEFNWVAYKLNDHE